MELLEKLELKLIDVDNKRDGKPDFHYIGQKYHILERLGSLIIATIIRREGSKIKTYIQENYSKELDKDKLVKSCMESLFGIDTDRECVIYEGIELIEHELCLPDFERKFNEQANLIFKNINNKTLKLEL